MRAFAPEVALASPMRAVLAVSLGAVALNLLRGVGTLGLIALTTAARSSQLPEGLTMAFVSDQLALLAGGLLAWVLLSAVTHAVARSQGGLGSPRVHYYLVAVAVSAWMPIAGVTGLLWWTAAMLLPGASTPLVASLACGLLFLYLATLATQAVHTAHDQEALQETATTGAFLLACVVIYAGLTALSPPVLRSPMLKVVEVVLLPLWP